MAQHAQLRIDTGLHVFFCDPRSPWQRGTNENTNGLLRQYFPKGTDLNRHSASDIAAVATTLNRRPRKTLGWRTPSEAFNELLLSQQRGRARRPLETGQYLSIRYTDRLADAGIDPSIGSIGDSYDKLAESVILYKTEVPASSWRHLEAVEFATLEWVDWFNHRRLLAPRSRAARQYYLTQEAPVMAAESTELSHKPGAFNRIFWPHRRPHSVPCFRGSHIPFGVQ